VTYAVLIERRAQRALAKIAQPRRDRIIAAIQRLGDEPRPAGVKKLSGREAWRIRVGAYRVLYEIRDSQLIVLIVDVGHRRGSYR
jgi:mRNA interferase RelE/StbE